MNQKKRKQIYFGSKDELCSKKSLNDLVKINQGLQISISERELIKSNDNFFYITNESLKQDGKKYYISKPNNSVICNENDILMTRTGNTGTVVTGVKGVFHNNFFKVDYKNYIEKNYLFYYLTSNKTQNMIKRYSGSSTIPDLNHSDFYKLKINFYDKHIQDLIGKKLSSIDKLIETKEKERGIYENLFL